MSVALVSLWLIYASLPLNPGVPVYGIGSNILSAAPLSTDRLYLSLYLEPYFRYRVWQTGTNFGAVVRPGSTSMFARVHLVNGYSPIMAAAIGRRLDMETHGWVGKAAGDQSLVPGSSEDELLKRIGVDGLIISFDYPISTAPSDSEWERVYRSAEGTVYHRRGGAIPAVRAWADPDAVYGDASIDHIVDGRQSVSANVNVPAGGKPVLIVFRRPFFPGLSRHFGWPADPGHLATGNDSAGGTAARQPWPSRSGLSSAGGPLREYRGGHWLAGSRGARDRRP